MMQHRPRIGEVADLGGAEGLQVSCRAMGRSSFLNAPEQAHRAGFEAAVRDHRAGRLREAISAYEALLRRAPNDAEVLQLLGLALGQLGRHADAAVLLARSVQLKPDRPAVL